MQTTQSVVRHLAADVAHAVAFLTRLPVPASLLDSPLDFSRCVWAFPLVGALVGGIANLALLLPLPPLTVAVLAFGIAVALTGALHEDGAADCADGFWGGGTKERRLEIMRRSDIGTYGTLALIVSSLLRVSAYATVALLHPALLIPAATAARVVMVWHWIALPPARGENGLSARFGTPDRRGAVLASILASTIFAISALLAPLATAFGLVGACASAFIVSVVSHRKIGGRTGDTLGATVVAGECGFLIGAILPIWPA